MPATVRQYELVYIVHPDRTDDQVQQVIDKYSKLITGQGGEIERTDIWERRRLAYDIKGQSEGVYIVCVFRGLPNVEAELRRVFRISEDTLRFIIVRPDEEIDTSVPSVQPRDFGARPQPPPPHAHAPHTPSVATAVAAPVEAEAAAPEAEVVAEDEAPAATEAVPEVTDAVAEEPVSEEPAAEAAEPETAAASA